MGGACGTYRRQKSKHEGFLWGDLSERNHFEGLGIDGSIIIKQIFKKWVGERQD